MIPSQLPKGTQKLRASGFSELQPPNTAFLQRVCTRCRGEEGGSQQPWPTPTLPPPHSVLSLPPHPPRRCCTLPLFPGCMHHARCNSFAQCSHLSNPPARKVICTTERKLQRMFLLCGMEEKLLLLQGCRLKFGPLYPQELYSHIHHLRPQAD